jgi:Casjensviridae head maturation protease
MQDVILAAASAAADGTVVPDVEAAQAADAGEPLALREAAARAAGESEGAKKGSACERDRIKSIITSDQAKGREELAHYFAFDTDLAADTVLLALAKSPAAKTTLDNAMALEAQPKLGTGGEHGSSEPPRMISTEEVYARRRAAVAAVSQR